MIKLEALILTLIAGLFFLIGGLISLKVKNKEKLSNFSIALAFIIMLDLILIDLFPEILGSFENFKLMSKISLIIIFSFLGFIILKSLDMFIPHHHHDHHEGEKNIQEHQGHVKHIGILTIISLLLHNILEGFAIFGMALNDFKLGLFMSISVALHNIPLGTHIFSSLSLSKNKILLFILSISSLVGGVVYLFFGSISETILGIVMSLTLGMIIYIALLELLPELIKNIRSKESLVGLIVGIIIFIISVFI